MNELQPKHRELKIISVIAASENTSHAVIVLGIAQANVSKYPADSESKVELKVLDHIIRQLTPTPSSIVLLSHTNNMLDRNEQLNNFIVDYKHEKRGKVTVYTPTGIIAYLSQHVIVKIMDIGDISLVLKTYNLDRKAFYEGVDFPDDRGILLSYAHPKGESLVAGFTIKHAVTTFASREYLTKNPISNPDELVNRSCIPIDSMVIDDANIWRFNSAEDKKMRDYRMTGNYICGDIQSVLVLACNHLGIAFTPNESVQKDYRLEILVPCLPE